MRTAARHQHVHVYAVIAGAEAGPQAAAPDLQLPEAAALPAPLPVEPGTILAGTLSGRKGNAETASGSTQLNTQVAEAPGALPDMQHAPTPHAGEERADAHVHAAQTQELNSKLKIPFEDITFHQVIGKGSFKTVYR